MNEPKRLRRLVDVKRRVRDAERSSLAGAARAVALARAHAERADAALQGAVDRLMHLGDISAMELSLRAAEVHSAGAIVGDAKDREATLEAARQAQRTTVIEAQRGLRTLEVLAERAEKSVEKRVRRDEQAHSDEIAARGGKGSR